MTTKVEQGCAGMQPVGSAADKPSLGNGSGTAEQFLRLLGKDPQKTWISSLQFPKRQGRRMRTDRRGVDAAALEALNNASHGIYFVTGDADQASGKTKATGKPNGCVEDADVHCCRAVFIEWDNRPIEWQLQAWRELKLPEPTAMVNSGGKSIHCYWRLEEPLEPEAWKALQSRLIDWGCGDTQCKNPSRLMRLPGFRYVNKKTGEVTAGRAELIHQTGNSYSAAEIEACLQVPTTPAPVKAAAAPPPQRGEWEPRSIEEINRAAEYIPVRVGGQGTYEQDRHALCGCSAALAEAGVTDADGAALALLGGKWPSEAEARQVLESSTTRNAASFWKIARKHGYDLKRQRNDRPAEAAPLATITTDGITAVVDARGTGWEIGEDGKAKRTKLEVGDLSRCLRKCSAAGWGSMSWRCCRPWMACPWRRMRSSSCTSACQKPAG